MSLQVWNGRGSSLHRRTHLDKATARTSPAPGKVSRCTSPPSFEDISVTFASMPSSSLPMASSLRVEPGLLQSTRCEVVREPSTHCFREHTATHDAAASPFRGRKSTFSDPVCWIVTPLAPTIPTVPCVREWCSDAIGPNSAVQSNLSPLPAPRPLGPRIALAPPALHWTVLRPFLAAFSPPRPLQSQLGPCPTVGLLAQACVCGWTMQRSVSTIGAHFLVGL